MNLLETQNSIADARTRRHPHALKCLVALGLLLCSGAPLAGAPIEYDRDVRPILSEHCYACHGPDAAHRKGGPEGGAGLRLDTQTGALADLGGAFAVVPGKPQESELVDRITTDDRDELMPPPKHRKPLSPGQKRTLVQWIGQGAKWSDYWAYVPPRRPPTPEVGNRRWGRNFIDAHLLSRLEAEGLEPAPPADRRTLIRRLSFDLTGLPPTRAQVEQFVADRRPDAYARLVERLLESPHHGERMAMHWLDLVRFADTVGYHGDQDHNITPYRDWVIQAFNDNMPFDRFTVEQLAGDLLPDTGIDQKVASGYNRLLQTSHEGGVQPREYLAIYAADRVRNLSAVWMGATLGCAQCHDHKFDPYTTRDFYSMVAFFADVDESQHFKKGSNSLPTKRPPEIKVLSRAAREEAGRLDRRLAELAKQIAALGGAKTDAAAKLRGEVADLKKRRAELEKTARLTMVTAAIEPRTIRILPRGNWLDDTGPVVKPAVPAFLGSVGVTDRRPTRLDLARWFASRENPLTARAFVNRLWAVFFGVGISKRLDDLGAQGEPPVHPRLLDALAVEFMDEGWDIRHMIRLIVTSSAYRQSSLVPSRLREMDPENRMVSRQSRYRLPAEMVRDNALATSGLLVPEIGGPSVKPYQPTGYYQHLNFPERRYQHHGDARQWRRGLYVHWQRQFLHPMLKAFDAPSREECAADRPISNTPLGALALLNDPTFVEAARAFAARILSAGGSGDDARIVWAFGEATGRPADRGERAILTRLLVSHRAGFKADPAAARKLAGVGLAKAPAGVDP
ncbi:MAG: PSD1 and planctomycete cytochrome C domain-containing protein, partial [Phycisphaerae bacterium]|nr:PSD1 and planctomycete cytochrome C domain-containing protein [Phycisphaerae bacterium]